MSATVSVAPVLTWISSLFIAADDRQFGGGGGLIPYDPYMTGTQGGTGVNLRLARQARGLSQLQLATMAGVSRQAVSAVESGHSDPSLRVALSLAQAIGLSVEELFGPGEPAAAVSAVSLAPLNGQGNRVSLASVGDRLVALPLRGDTGAGFGFLPAGGLVTAPAKTAAAKAAPAQAAPVQAGPVQDAQPALDRGPPIGPPRPTLVVAGCDPALPLLATPLALLDPPVAFAWWPCGSAAALRLASQGLVHAAGVHAGRETTTTKAGRSRTEPR